MSVKVIEYRCPQNHRCPAAMVCPVGAMKQIGADAPIVDNDKCTNCGKCVRYCPTGALQMDAI